MLLSFWNSLFFDIWENVFNQKYMLIESLFKYYPLSIFKQLCTITNYGQYHLYFSADILQGDRGFEGPRGNRGLPGIGFKGDKVKEPAMQLGDMSRMSTMLQCINRKTTMPQIFKCYYFGGFPYTVDIYKLPPICAIFFPDFKIFFYFLFWREPSPFFCVKLFIVKLYKLK